MNKKVSYIGDVIFMYIYMGIYIDVFNYFGFDGKIWNGFILEKYLGDKGWFKIGVEIILFIIVRGILIDVLFYKGVSLLF